MAMKIFCIRSLSFRTFLETFRVHVLQIFKTESTCGVTNVSSSSLFNGYSGSGQAIATAPRDSNAYHGSTRFQLITCIVTILTSGLPAIPVDYQSDAETQSDEDHVVVRTIHYLSTNRS